MPTAAIDGESVYQRMQNRTLAHGMCSVPSIHPCLLFVYTWPGLESVDNVIIFRDLRVPLEPHNPCQIIKDWSCSTESTIGLGPCRHPSVELSIAADLPPPSFLYINTVHRGTRKCVSI